MKFFHSIRWRLQLWHGLLLLVGFGFTAWRLQQATQIQRVDRELEQRISVLVGALRRGDGTPGRPPAAAGPSPAAGSAGRRRAPTTTGGAFASARLEPL